MASYPCRQFFIISTLKLQNLTPYFSSFSLMISEKASKTYNSFFWLFNRNSPIFTYCFQWYYLNVKHYFLHKILYRLTDNLFSDTIYGTEYRLQCIKWPITERTWKAQNGCNEAAETYFTVVSRGLPSLIKLKKKPHGRDLPKLTAKNEKVSITTPTQLQPM